MILQLLNMYYERMRNTPDSVMPPYGISLENISYALVLNSAGMLQAVESLWILEKKNKIPRVMAVPMSANRTSGIIANFLWDKASYVLGADQKGVSEKTFSAFKNLFEEVGVGLSDEGFKAVQLFLEKWNPYDAASIISQFEAWDDIAKANIVFRLEGVKGFIHERPNIQNAWVQYIKNKRESDAPRVKCLVTGEEDMPQADVHTPIKGVPGGQASGGYIVSFNATAFTSYGKDKADVGETSAFAYTTALNALLRRGSRQKVTIGDSTIAFWAERATPAEDFFADLFDPVSPKEESKDGTEHDPGTANLIYDLLRTIRSGKHAVDIVPALDESVRFYLLALAPNAARLSIRFWETSTIGSLLKQVGKHFAQLEMVRRFENEPEFPPLWRLLSQTACLGKNENVSPVLAGGMARAMLTGMPYPQSLLATVLGRIRAEHTVTYFRAALIKAFLIRNKKMEVPVSYDPERTDVPYLLGSLFAVLERAQEEAIPGTNATIKDRYLGSASANPGQVFHMLLKNSANHIAKLRKDSEKNKFAFYYEKMMQDIISDLDEFPSSLSAEDQGVFMIGYYHKRKDFFTKKNKEN